MNKYNLNIDSKKYILELNRSNVVIRSGGEVTNAVWGTITGDINQQTDLQEELTSIKESIPEPYNDTEIKENIHTLQSTKADKSEIPDISNLASKDEIPDTSTLATKTELEEGLSTKADTSSLDGLATKTELSSGLDSKADKADTYTKSEIDEKNYLTSETDPTVPSWAKEETKPVYTANEVGAIPTGGLKTINGQTLEGEGNIVIDSPEGGITDSPSDGKLYGRKDGTWAEVVIPTIDVDKAYVDSALEGKLDKSVYESEKINFVTSTALDGYATKTEVENTYQAKGDYALKSEIPDISRLATKTELASKANTSDVYSKADIDEMLGNIDTILDNIIGTYSWAEL